MAGICVRGAEFLLVLFSELTRALAWRTSRPRHIGNDGAASYIQKKALLQHEVQWSQNVIR